MSNSTVASICVLAGLAVIVVSATGCGTAPAAETGPSGISPEKFADAVHAVMMADRTVYATHVVTRLKNQSAPVAPSEYWQDEEHTIPLPAQMFRMGAELVDENPEAGFTYGLKSLWPLNPQHKPQNDTEIEALTYLSENPGETFSGEEELGGNLYFTKYYPDRAVAEACWSCHNEHPNKGDDYPEFSKDDVMGAVVVRVPID